MLPFARSLFKLPFGPQIGQGSRRPSCLLHTSRARERPARPSPTRPQEVLGFEEMLSELIARARMLRPHLGSRLFSALLTFRVHYRTLSGEERCGRMKANPQWYQFAHRPLPSSRSARMPMRAYNRCTARLIPRSWLQERCCEQRGYVIGGGRLLLDLVD